MVAFPSRRSLCSRARRSSLSRRDDRQTIAVYVRSQNTHKTHKHAQEHFVRKHHLNTHNHTQTRVTRVHKHKTLRVIKMWDRTTIRKCYCSVYTVCLTLAYDGDEEPESKRTPLLGSHTINYTGLVSKNREKRFMLWTTTMRKILGIVLPTAKTNACSSLQPSPSKKLRSRTREDGQHIAQRRVHFPFRTGVLPNADRTYLHTYCMQCNCRLPGSPRTAVVPVPGTVRTTRYIPGIPYSYDVCYQVLVLSNVPWYVLLAPETEVKNAVNMSSILKTSTARVHPSAPLPGAFFSPRALPAYNSRSSP